MRTIFAEYNPHRNSIDIYTSAGYMLRIDCCQSHPEPTLQFFLYIQSAASLVTPAVTAQSSPAVSVMARHARKCSSLSLILENISIHFF